MRISERGQITIPKRLRDQFGMHHDVEVEITATDGGLLIRKRADIEHPVYRVCGILNGTDVPYLAEGDVDGYIEAIRGR